MQPIYVFIFVGPVLSCRYLALVSIMREESFDKAGLVEYNITLVKQAIGELLEAKKRAAAPKAARSQAVPIKGK